MADEIRAKVPPTNGGPSGDVADDGKAENLHAVIDAARECGVY